MSERLSEKSLRVELKELMFTPGIYCQPGLSLHFKACFILMFCSLHGLFTTLSVLYSNLTKLHAVCLFVINVTLLLET